MAKNKVFSSIARASKGAGKTSMAFAGFTKSGRIRGSGNP
jgi:hypothetical protein